MANPAVTYTFSNSTTADASQVNQNFTDLISGMTDGTKDFSINALTCAGAATLNGHVTLGNSSSDDLTVTASLASSLSIKTTFSYDVGSATIGLKSIYFGSNDSAAKSVRVIAGAVGTSYTVTLPTGVPTIAKSVMTFDTSGVASFEHRSVMTVVSKTNSDSPYTALSSDQLILCNAASGAITVNLPAASTVSGKVLLIKKTDTSLVNAVTIATNSTETIDGVDGTTLNTQYESIEIVSDGSNWHIIERKIPSVWIAWTPTGAWTGNATYSGYWRRVGDTFECEAYVIVSAAPTPTSTTLTIVYPTGIVHDSAKSLLSNNALAQGQLAIRDSTPVAYYPGQTRHTDSAYAQCYGLITGALVGITHNSIITIAASDAVHIKFAIPVVGWNG